MRLRFFLFISVLFVLSHLVVLWATNQAWERLYWQLIDQKIETIAAVIQKVPFNQQSFDEIEIYQNRIKEALGDPPINIFFRIYDAQKRLLINETNIQLPEIFHLTSTISKQTAHLTNVLVRYVVVPVTVKGALQRYLVVGYWRTEHGLREQIWRMWIPLVMAFVFVVTLVVTLALVRLLTNPLERVVKIMNASAKIVTQPQVDAYLRELNHLSDYPEFNQLVKALQNWALAVRERFQKIHSVNSQLMHEMKTPLTLLIQTIERPDLCQNPELLIVLKSQVENLRDVVVSFLEWLQAQYELPFVWEKHVISAQELLRQVAETMGLSNMVIWKISQDFRFYGPLFYFRRMWLNILTNARQYSTNLNQWQIEIEIDKPKIRVSNYGRPFPKEVKERLGLAFNVDKSYPHGHGLGLAWVALICQHFNLILDVVSQPTDHPNIYRVTVEIDFSPLLIQDTSE